MRQLFNIETKYEVKLRLSGRIEISMCQIFIALWGVIQATYLVSLANNVYFIGDLIHFIQECLQQLRVNRESEHLKRTNLQGEGIMTNNCISRMCDSSQICICNIIINSNLFFARRLFK